MVELIDKDEIIEIKNTKGYSLQEILNSLNGKYIRIYDYIFNCNQIKMIRLGGAGNE